MLRYLNDSRHVNYEVNTSRLSTMMFLMLDKGPAEVLTITYLIMHNDEIWFQHCSIHCSSSYSKLTYWLFCRFPIARNL